MFWGQLGGRREESSWTSASCFAGLAAGLYLGLETIVVLVVLVVVIRCLRIVTGRPVLFQRASYK